MHRRESDTEETKEEPFIDLMLQMDLSIKEIYHELLK
jgi:hypothetical protein